MELRVFQVCVIATLICAAAIAVGILGNMPDVIDGARAATLVVGGCLALSGIPFIPGLVQTLKNPRAWEIENKGARVL